MFGLETPRSSVMTGSMNQVYDICYCDRDCQRAPGTEEGRAPRAPLVRQERRDAQRRRRHAQRRDRALDAPLPVDHDTQESPLTARLVRSPASQDPKTVYDSFTTVPGPLNRVFCHSRAERRSRNPGGQALLPAESGAGT